MTEIREVLSKLPKPTILSWRDTPTLLNSLGIWSQKNSWIPTLVNESEIPKKINWGINHHTFIGRVVFGISSSSYSSAVFRRFNSTRAAITMVMAIKNIPIPILWSIVMPDGFLVKDLAIGTNMRSYIGMKMRTVRALKNWSEAAGMWKPEPIDLSSVVPCLVNKVGGCASTIPYPKHVAHMGNSLSTAFASSTSLRLHAFPFSPDPPGRSNALLRNLP